MVEGEGVEHVDRFTMSHKLLESLFKSSLAKTTMAHFVWSPGFPLKIWMYLVISRSLYLSAFYWNMYYVGLGYSVFISK